MLGVYYLHENGDLIYKSKAVFTNTTLSEYMDSPFVITYWIISEKSPTGDVEKDIMWTMDWLFSAITLSKNKEKTGKRIREICKTNGYPDIIADTIIKGKEKKE